MWRDEEETDKEKKNCDNILWILLHIDIPFPRLDTFNQSKNAFK